MGAYFPSSLDCKRQWVLILSILWKNLPPSRKIHCSHLLKSCWRLRSILGDCRRVLVEITILFSWLGFLWALKGDQPLWACHLWGIWGVLGPAEATGEIPRQYTTWVAITSDISKQHIGMFSFDKIYPPKSQKKNNTKQNGCQRIRMPSGPCKTLPLSLMGVEWLVKGKLWLFSVRWGQRCLSAFDKSYFLLKTRILSSEF